jgi:hypothetical protein
MPEGPITPSGKLFLTKAWGFQPENHPVSGFSKEGARHNFLRSASHGDWIVIAGTMGDDTAPEERGKLLGMCQVGHDEVNSHDILEAIGRAFEGRELNGDGIYKWSWGLPMIRARRFTPQPYTKDILGSNLSGQVWAVYARDLEAEVSKEVIDRIWELPAEECTIHEIPEIKRQGSLAGTLRRNRKNGASGPPPSSSRKGSESEIGSGYAYALQMVGGLYKDVIKIGYSRDFKDRFATLNREIRTAVTGCHWEAMLTNDFENVAQAYNFEQLLLEYFADNLVDGELEIIRASRDDVQFAWVSILKSCHWEIENGDD